MTGDILRRIREAHGFTHREVAKAARYSGSDVVCRTEASVSHKAGDAKASNTRRQASWLRVLDALRKLRGSLPKVRCEVSASPWAGQFVPKGTTHLLAGEPVRVVDYHGRRFGFAWDGEWVRSERVEQAKALEVL